MMKPKFAFSILFLFFFLFLARGGWLPTDQRIDSGDSPGASDSYHPRIAHSGDNVYVAWEDRRDGWRDIYFNSSTDGGASWQSSDIRLDTGDSPGVYESYDIQIACSGLNVYVVWLDARNGARDIYFNYSADGGATWQTPDIRLDTGDPAGASYSWYPQIACSDTNVHVVWHDYRTEPNADIYYNYSTDGGTTWQTPDIRLDTGDTPGSHGSYAPEIVCSGDNVYVVWQDDRNGEFYYDIYFIKSTDGGVSWPSQEILINTGDTPGTSESWNPQIACSGDNLYVVWEDERNGEYNFDIYFNYSTDGGENWQASDIRLNTGDSPGVSESLDAQIACSGDNVYVVWSDFRNAPNTYTDIYFNHSADGGANWQTPDIRLNTGDLPGASESWGPQIACSNGNVYAVWTDRRGGSHISDIFFNYSTEEGANWRTKDIRLNSRKLPIDYHAQYPQIACSGENIYVVWQDSRNGLYDIYFNSNISSTFALTISASKGGTVRPKPGEHSHIPGTKVKIEAFPDKDYKFSHWSGDVEGSENPIKFTMDSDKTIKAHFIKQHTLALRSQKGGTTSPSPGSHTFDHGTEVTITAIPESNFRFSNWTGDVLSTENPLTIEMNSNMSITANFVRQYNLTLDTGTGGTTNPPPGTYPYDKGSKATITAAPHAHHRFFQWTGDLSRTSNPATITMNRDKSITANFSRIIYAPPNFSGQKVSNRSLTQVEYINVLTWQPHPNNVNISKYRIYSIEGETQSLLVEFPANTHQYLHRQVAKDKTYTYILVAVNNEGREGDPAQISVR